MKKFLTVILIFISITVIARERLLAITSANFDFTYKQDVCDPYTVQFFSVSSTQTNPYWSFGDGTTSTGNLNPVHSYTAAGNYTVKYSLQNGRNTSGEGYYLKHWPVEMRDDGVYVGIEASGGIFGWLK